MEESGNLLPKRGPAGVSFNGRLGNPRELPSFRGHTPLLDNALGDAKQGLGSSAVSLVVVPSVEFSARRAPSSNARGARVPVFLQLLPLLDEPIPGPAHGIKIVSQKVFSSLDEFAAGQQNYYAHFLKGNSWGETKRKMPHFQRFQRLKPGLEKEATALTLEAHFKSVKTGCNILKILPYEVLFKTYRIMSYMVFSHDETAARYSVPEELLIR